MKIHYPTRSTCLVGLMQHTMHQRFIYIIGGGKNRSAIYQYLLAKTFLTACAASHNNHFTFAKPNSCLQP